MIHSPDTRAALQRSPRARRRCPTAPPRPSRGRSRGARWTGPWRRSARRAASSFLPVDRVDGREDLLDEHGGQAHRRLVEQQQARARHEGTRDGEHLLLAARERAGHLRHALLEAREQLEDAVEVGVDVAVGTEVRAHGQVFAHRQPIEDSPALGHVRDPARDDLVRGDAGERVAVEDDGAAARDEEARDGLERGRLAGAVVAEQRHDLAAADLERDAAQRVDLAVVHVQRFEPEHD